MGFLFFIYNPTLPQPLFLFGLSLHRRGSLPSIPMLHVLSLPVLNHTPMAIQVVPVVPWRCLHHSAAWTLGIPSPPASTLLCLRDERTSGPPTSPPSWPALLLLTIFFIIRSIYFLTSLSQMLLESQIWNYAFGKPNLKLLTSFEMWHVSTWFLRGSPVLLIFYISV